MRYYRHLRPSKITDKVLNREVDWSIDYVLSSGVYSSWDEFKIEEEIDELRTGDFLYKDGMFGVWLDGEMKEYNDEIGRSGSKAMSFLDLLLERYEKLDSGDLSTCECHVFMNSVCGNFDAFYNGFLVRVSFVLSKSGAFSQMVYKIYFNENYPEEESMLNFIGGSIEKTSVHDEYDNKIVIKEDTGKSRELIQEEVDDIPTGKHYFAERYEDIIRLL